MNRRELLTQLAASTAALGIGSLRGIASGLNVSNATTLPGLMDTRGERYTAVVPDTLDLTDRAAMAIPALLKFANSREVDPRVTTDRSVCGPKYLEALAFTRTMTGDHDGTDFEQSIM